MFALFKCLRRKLNLDFKILQLEVKFKFLRRKINTLNADVSFSLEGGSSLENYCESYMKENY